MGRRVNLGDYLIVLAIVTIVVVVFLMMIDPS